MDFLPEYLVENAGPLGGVLAALLLLVGALVRSKGWAIFGPPKSATTEEKIDQKVGSILRRVDRIEADLEQRPTRAELHQVQNSITRLDERVSGVMRTTEKTNLTVTRIEDFLLSLAKDSR
jgi:hypothetical protein